MWIKTVLRNFIIGTTFLYSVIKEFKVMNLLFLRIWLPWGNHAIISCVAWCCYFHLLFAECPFEPNFCCKMRITEGPILLWGCISILKGQKKSIWFFQKTNKRILLYCYETSGRLVFVRFLEEIEDTKTHFKNQLTFKHCNDFLLINDIVFWHVLLFEF